MTLQVPVLVIEYLVAVPFELYIVKPVLYVGPSLALYQICDRKKCYASLIKGLIL